LRVLKGIRAMMEHASFSADNLEKMNKILHQLAAAVLPSRGEYLK